MTKQKLNAAATIAMAMVLAGLALTWWAGQRRNATYGPAVVAIDRNDGVWVLADRSLFILDDRDTLRVQATLESLGMHRSVSAIAPLPEGGAVAAAHDTGLLYLLDDDGRVRRTIDPAATGIGHLRNGVALQADAERIYVAHIGHHRLLALDRSGAIVAQAGATNGLPGDFHFPNEIVPGLDGKLWVTDTNQHEIEALDRDLKRVGPRVAVPPIAGTHWPVFAAQTRDSQLAVVQLNNGMREGVAALLDMDGKVTKRLEMQVNAEPTSLALRKNEILVADQHKKRFQVRRFDLDGLYAGELGDPAFLGAMRAASARHRLYASLRLAGQALALVAAGVLLLVYKKSQAARDEVPVAPAPVSRSIQSSLLLSALLPGLGHLNQQRRERGALWLGSFVALAVMNGLQWFVHLERIAAVPVPALVASSLLLFAVWAVALREVWQNGRR